MLACATALLSAACSSATWPSSRATSPRSCAAACSYRSPRSSASTREGAKPKRGALQGTQACTTARRAACAAPLASARRQPARARLGGAAGQAAAGGAGGGAPCSRAWALATAPRAESSCARSSSTLRRSSVSSPAARLSCTTGDQGGMAQRHIAVGTGGAGLRLSAAALLQRCRDREAGAAQAGDGGGCDWNSAQRGGGEGWRAADAARVVAAAAGEAGAHLAGGAGSGSPPLEQLQCTVEWVLILSASGTLDTAPRWAGKPAGCTGRSWGSCSTPLASPCEAPRHKKAAGPLPWTHLCHHLPADDQAQEEARVHAKAQQRAPERVDWEGEGSLQAEARRPAPPAVLGSQRDGSGTGSSAPERARDCPPGVMQGCHDARAGYRHSSVPGTPFKRGRRHSWEGQLLLSKFLGLLTRINETQ